MLFKFSDKQIYLSLYFFSKYLKLLIAKYYKTKLILHELIPVTVTPDFWRKYGPDREPVGFGVARSYRFLRSLPDRQLGFVFGPADPIQIKTISDY